MSNVRRGQLALAVYPGRSRGIWMAGDTLGSLQFMKMA